MHSLAYSLFKVDDGGTLYVGIKKISLTGYFNLYILFPFPLWNIGLGIKIIYLFAIISIISFFNPSNLAPEALSCPPLR